MEFVLLFWQYSGSFGYIVAFLLYIGTFDFISALLAWYRLFQHQIGLFKLKIGFVDVYRLFIDRLFLFFISRRIHIHLIWVNSYLMNRFLIKLFRHVESTASSMNKTMIAIVRTIVITVSNIVSMFLSVCLFFSNCVEFVCLFGLFLLHVFIIALLLWYDITTIVAVFISLAFTNVFFTLSWVFLSVVVVVSE